MSIERPPAQKAQRPIADRIKSFYHHLANPSRSKMMEDGLEGGDGMCVRYKNECGAVVNVICDTLAKTVEHLDPQPTEVEYEQLYQKLTSPETIAAVEDFLQKNTVPRGWSPWELVAWVVAYPEGVGAAEAARRFPTSEQSTKIGSVITGALDDIRKEREKPVKEAELDPAKVAPALRAVLQNLAKDEVLRGTSESGKGAIAARLQDAAVAGTSITQKLGMALGIITKLPGLDFSELKKLGAGLVSPQDRFTVIFGLLANKECLAALNENQEGLVKVVGEIFGATKHERDAHVTPMVSSLLEVLNRLPPEPQSHDFMDFLGKITTKLCEVPLDHGFAKGLETFVEHTTTLAAKHEHGFLHDLFNMITFMPDTKAYKAALQPALNEAIVGININRAARSDRLKLVDHMYEFRKAKSHDFLDSYADQYMQWCLFNSLDIGTKKVGDQLNLSNCDVAGVDFTTSRFTNTGGVSFANSLLKNSNFYLAKFEGPVDFTGATIDELTLKTLLPSIKDALINGIEIRFDEKWSAHPDIKQIQEEVEAFREMEAVPELKAMAESQKSELAIKRKLLDVATVGNHSVKDSRNRLATNISTIDAIYEEIKSPKCTVGEQRALCHLMASADVIAKLQDDDKRIAPEKISDVIEELKTRRDFTKLAEEFARDPNHNPDKGKDLSPESLQGLKGLLSFVGSDKVAGFFEHKPGQKQSSVGEFLRKRLEGMVGSIFAENSIFGQLIATRSAGQIFGLVGTAIWNWRTVTKALPAFKAGGVDIFNSLAKDKDQPLMDLFGADNNKTIENLLFAIQSSLQAQGQEGNAKAAAQAKGLQQLCKLMHDKGLGDRVQDLTKSKNWVETWKGITELIGQAGQKELVVLLKDLAPLISGAVMETGNFKRNMAPEVKGRKPRKSVHEKALEVVAPVKAKHDIRHHAGADGVESTAPVHTDKAGLHKRATAVATPATAIGTRHDSSSNGSHRGAAGKSARARARAQTQGSAKI